MPTDLDLIKYEQIANTIFIISTLYSYASANKAAQTVIERQENTPPSSSSSSAAESAQFALSSTWYTVIAYVIFSAVAIIRKNKLEQQIQAGTSTTSIIPNIFITSGFIVSLIGVIMRLPGVQQRVIEAQVPVIL